MKRKNLFLLLIMALLVIVPNNVKAFNVSVGGDCHVAAGVTPSGTAEQLCYTGTDREITFITSQESPTQKYFCLQEDAYLDEATYGNEPIATYSNRGHACAVYNALRAGTITIDNLRSAMGNVDSGTINFNVTANGANYTVTSVTPGTPADTYIKIQQAIWSLNNPDATCTTPYVESTTAPKINSLSATMLTKDNETDTYMYSKVTVSKNSAVTSYNVSVTGVAGAIVSSNKTAAGQINGALTGNEFYVLVPADTTSTSITVTATASYTKRSVTNVTIQEYKSNVTRNQTLGKLSATITSESTNTSANTKIVANPVIDFKICKKNSKTNAAMAGIKFTVTSSDKSKTFELTTGSDGCAIKENVAKDTYTLHEVATPSGFKKNADIQVDCTEISPGSICKYDVLNTPITLKVKKLDESNDPLVDAEMEILDKDGKRFDYWTTGITEDHIVNKDIPFGKYTLIEREAPDGYVISTQIEFEIKEDGYVVGGVTKAYGDDAVVTVTMIDKATKVSILKIDADTGEPLVGAKLQIELEDGTPVGEPWITDGTPKVFTKMSFGTYYLVELEAPEGYVLQEERTPFVISHSSEDEQVVIENHAVPSTAANKSALLISFAMLDIALGIAILLYVRKRKAME